MRFIAEHRRALVAFLPGQLLLLAVLSFASATQAVGDVQIEDIDTITILPIVFPANQTEEDRAESLESLYGKLDDYIYKALLRKLALKGYVLDKPRGWSTPVDWTVERLKPLAPQELAAIVPETASHAAFLFIERIDSSSQVVKSSASAAVSVMILQRDTGAVVWSRADEGRFSENIIFSGMWLTPDKHAAIEKAFERIFEHLPEKRYQ